MPFEGISVDQLNVFCGAMNRLGVEISSDEVRRRYSLNSDQVNLSALKELASDLGIQIKTVLASKGRIGSLLQQLPLIALTSRGALLLIEGAVQDPSMGLICIVRDAENKTATLGNDQLAQLGITHFLTLKLVGGRQLDDAPFGLEWLINAFRSDKHLLRDIIVSTIISSIFAIAPAMITMIIMDRVITNHSGYTLSVLAVVVAVFILFDTLLNYSKRHILEIMALRIDAKMNLYMMHQLLRLPLDYFETNQTGNTLARISRVWLLRNFITGQFVSTILDLTMVAVLFPILFILQWQLALFVGLCGALIFLIIVIFIKPVGARFAKHIEADREKNSYLVETIQGIKTIKSLALENARRIQWDLRISRSLSTRYAVGTMANIPQTLAMPFERLMYSGALILGAAILIAKPDAMNPGALMAFGMIAGRVASPLVGLAKLIDSLGEVRSSLSEAAGLLNHPKEQTRTGFGLRGPIRGNISFSEVEFRYSPTAPLALSGVTFNVPEGTMLGIMGRSGSGKSTITRLLQGLAQSYTGVIKVDGMDLREIEIPHLRSHIGVVPQENFLFRGTIRENICIAKPTASFSEVVRAAQLSGAEEFIERLQRGYDTPLEEGASNLSGGQRQRLALARALLIDPPILVLDEATSALDPESEAIINSNIMKIAENRTIICVSHRLSMIVPADAIMVMERGKVYDIGTHHELLHRCDIYKHMWNQQNEAATSSAKTLRPLTLPNH